MNSFYQITALANGSPSITLPDSSNAYCVDYTKRHCVNVKYNGKKVVGSYQVPKGTIIGKTYYYVGRYRRKKKESRKYYDAMFIKLNMQPQKVMAKNKKGKKKIRYGFSQYVSIKSYLPNTCQLQNATPNNTTIGESSYSIGISGGSDSSAGISGSLNVNNELCNVTDYSNIGKEKFLVSYDYKPTWDFTEWGKNSKRSKMLFNSTWQMGTCEWTSSAKDYKFKLKIYAKYGLSSGKTGGDIYCPEKKYSSQNAQTYILKYTKNMK